MGTRTGRDPRSKIKYSKHQSVKVKSTKNLTALRWWIGTVALTLFPTIITILIAFLQEDTQITLELVFGDGEIIFASFLIVVSTSLTGYNINERTPAVEVVHSILIFLGAVQVASYAIIKTNTTNNTITLVILSLAALILSILVSRIWFMFLTREVNDDEVY